jgi:hypothetical protein
MSSHRCLALSCTTLLLLMALPLAPQAPSIIQPRIDRVTGPPLWISAEAVLDAEKIIDLDKIQSSFLRDLVEKQRRSLGDQLPDSGIGSSDIRMMAQSECKSGILTSEHRGGWAPSSTLADLKAYSQSIVRGTILTEDAGFAFGIPEILLGVEVSAVIKGAAPKSPFYLDYPVARFKIGPFTFCSGEKGFEPRVGDEILLFDYIGAVDSDDILYVPRLDQILFQQRDGFLYLPPRLDKSPGLEKARNLDDIVGLVRALEVQDKKASRTDILHPDDDQPQ